MKHRIGVSTLEHGFNFVEKLKLVKEDDFKKQLEVAIKSLGGDNVAKGIKQAQDFLKTGKSVTIGGKYFIIQKR